MQTLKRFPILVLLAHPTVLATITLGKWWHDMAVDWLEWIGFGPAQAGFAAFMSLAFGSIAAVVGLAWAKGWLE